MKKKSAVTNKEVSSAPRFREDAYMLSRAICADMSGQLWIVDPKKGTITPVKVKNAP